jgi:hypothetical protein
MNAEIRDAYKILVGSLKECYLLVRRRHRSKDNIQMDVRKTGWDVMVIAR